jgi:uncharacterized protein YbjT (DUF2867 family)
VTTVLVLGATGNTGSEVVAELARRPHPAIRTASRSGGGSHRFDWADPGTHDAALDGVQQMYLVAPVGDPDPMRVVGPFLERAARHGVEHVVMLSSSVLNSGDPGLGEVAAAVQSTMPRWHILRPSWFMQNFVGAHPIASSIRATGRFVTATGTGRVPFIDARDIGRCAAALLGGGHPHNGEYRLTGPAALTYDEAAVAISSVLRRPVRHQAVSASVCVDHLVESGYDARFAAVLVALDEVIRRGEEAAVTNTVEQLTGAPPRSLPQFLQAHTVAPL